jgi:hypothetical protein
MRSIMGLVFSDVFSLHSLTLTCTHTHTTTHTLILLRSLTLALCSHSCPNLRLQKFLDLPGKKENFSVINGEYTTILDFYLDVCYGEEGEGGGEEEIKSMK